MKPVLFLAVVSTLVSFNFATPPTHFHLDNALARQILASLAESRIDDPWSSPEQNDFKFNFTSPPDSYAQGDMGYHDLIITGLGTLLDDLKFNFLLLTAVGSIKIPTFHLTSEYKANLLLKNPITTQQYRGVGNGHIDATINNFEIEFETKIRADLVNNWVSIYNLDATVTFGGPISVKADGATWDGKLINWTEFDKNIKTNLENFFKNEKAAAMRVTESVLNRLLQEWHLTDIIG